MTLSNITKVMLTASAVAGFALIAIPSHSKAQVASSCAAYARNVADTNAPRDRGLIGGLVALPFDVTSAVLTGRTSYDYAWRDAYNAAYADCISRQRVAVVTTEEPDVAVTVRPHNADWLAYCAAKYRSFDPNTGTYVTYSGEVGPCR